MAAEEGVLMLVLADVSGVYFVLKKDGLVAVWEKDGESLEPGMHGVSEVLEKHDGHVLVSGDGEGCCCVAQSVVWCEGGPTVEKRLGLEEGGTVGQQNLTQSLCGIWG